MPWTARIGQACNGCLELARIDSFAMDRPAFE